jgi:uncharacterized cupin superfamily protein
MRNDKRMLEFTKSDAGGPLQALPPLNQNSAYEVLRGNPLAPIRLDEGELDSKIRVGVWRCTTGTFHCVETGDELQTVTSGRVRLERVDGSHTTFGAGESFFTRKGERLIWDVLEVVEKVFFTFNRDGR